MTINVNIHEANTHLSRLLEQVAAGERVVISKAGTPVADLLPHQAATVTFGPGSSTGPGSPARHPGPAREPGPQPSQGHNAPVISVSMPHCDGSRDAAATARPPQPGTPGTRAAAATGGTGQTAEG